QEKVVSAAVCKEMLDHLKNAQDRDCFPRFLPAKTVVAHKTGSVNKVRTDGGIIYTPGGPVAVGVLTADNQDERWVQDNAGRVLCARVAEAVYQHYSPKKKP